MRLIMLSAISLALPVFTEASEAAGWPEYMGPNGNLYLDDGVTVSSEPSKYSLVWSSEETNMGGGKFGSGYPRIGAAKVATHLLPGGLCSPVLADGLVYLHYFQPTTTVFATASFSPRENQDPSPEGMRHYRILADDVDVAIDAATGRTVWKYVRPEQGGNFYTTKRNGQGVTGAIRDGRYFSMTTMGELLAFDARTGDLLWSRDTKTSEKMRNIRDQHIMARAMLAPQSYPENCRGHLCVADGVVIAPLYEGGIAGFDMVTGAALWSKGMQTSSTCNAGYRIVVEGCELVLVMQRHGNDNGTVHCLDPRSGEAIWSVGGLAPMHAPITVHEDTFLVLDCDGKPFVDDWRGGRLNSKWSRYRATMKGAVRLWRSPLACGPLGDTNVVLRQPTNGQYLFVQAWSAPEKLANLLSNVAVLSMATGEISYENNTPDADGSKRRKIVIGWIWGDLLFSRNESDGDSPIRLRGKAAPGDHLLSMVTLEGVKDTIHCGYETVTLPAYGGGYAYFRSEKQMGSVECWNVSADKTGAPVFTNKLEADPVCANLPEELRGLGSVYLQERTQAATELKPDALLLPGLATLATSGRLPTREAAALVLRRYGLAAATILPMLKVGLTGVGEAHAVQILKAMYAIDPAQATDAMGGYWGSLSGVDSRKQFLCQLYQQPDLVAAMSVPLGQVLLEGPADEVVQTAGLIAQLPPEAAAKFLPDLTMAAKRLWPREDRGTSLPYGVSLAMGHALTKANDAVAADAMVYLNGYMLGSKFTPHSVLAMLKTVSVDSLTLLVEGLQNPKWANDRTLKAILARIERASDERR